MIQILDAEGMDLIAGGDYQKWIQYIRDTGNSICGR
jgi:predicted class III extradiol MEMO1 family dioxygenase